MNTAARRSAAMTRSYSSQSSWVPPAATKIARSSAGRSFTAKPEARSSGPMIVVAPSTATHCQPDLATAVARGRCRRFASLRAPPAATSATDSTRVNGLSVTPAFTTDACVLPSARLVASTISPWSAEEIWVKSLRSVTRATVRLDEAVEPGLVQARVLAAPADQVGGGAVLDDAAGLEHEHAVGDLHR